MNFYVVENKEDPNENEQRLFIQSLVQQRSAIITCLLETHRQAGEKVLQ